MTTLQKILTFLGIIFLGIIGLMVADQIDFSHGRTLSHQNTIGNGTSDPILTESQKESSRDIKQETVTKLSPSKIQTTSSAPAAIPNIDGVRSQKK
jgi:hypothetical protein